MSNSELGIRTNNSELNSGKQAKSELHIQTLNSELKIEYRALKSHGSKSELYSELGSEFRVVRSNFEFRAEFRARYQIQSPQFARV